MSPGRRATGRRPGGTGDTRQYAMVRLIGIALFVSALIFTVLGELVRNGVVAVSGFPAKLPRTTTVVMELAGAVVALAALALAAAARRVLADRAGRFARGFVLGMLAANTRRGGSSSMLMCVLPLALSEFVVVLGFVVFLLGVQTRWVVLSFYAAGILSLAASFPTTTTWERAENLDRSMRGSRR
jgi:hypothetical protein